MILRRYKKEVSQVQSPENTPTIEKKVETVVDAIDYTDYTRAELKNILDEQGINYSERDSKTRLLEILELHGK